ncbi:cytochrome c family protein [Paracoccus suum]|uniref:Cytochrome c family protein n=1 Tax=Paracoccus suum TaxID=2259340 RepID=A0A344PKN6_9RHOB|nr:cytochrome c family protein [Paracoccus suum]AXC49941.1 cytochrome c family protein [Paracoccus suum]
MFNTMTITKTAGALIGSLLVLLLVSWAASSIYHVGGPEHHAEGEAPAQAYTIAVEEAAPAGGAPAEQIDFGALMASADAAKGEKVFGKCKTCHSVEGKDGTGPHLNGVVGRAVASVAGFNYDDAMKAHAGEAPTWTPEALQEFLTNPKGVVPGTKMAFAGLPKPQDRADLIAFLQQHGG